MIVQVLHLKRWLFYYAILIIMTQSDKMYSFSAIQSGVDLHHQEIRKKDLISYKSYTELYNRNYC